MLVIYYIYNVLDWFNVHPEDLGEIYLVDKGLGFRWVVQPPPHICSKLHTVTRLFGRSSIKDDMDFFQRNGG